MKLFNLSLCRPKDGMRNLAENTCNIYATKGVANNLPRSCEKRHAKPSLTVRSHCSFLRQNLVPKSPDASYPHLPLTEAKTNEEGEHTLYGGARHGTWDYQVPNYHGGRSLDAFKVPISVVFSGPD